MLTATLTDRTGTITIEPGRTSGMKRLGLACCATALFVTQAAALTPREAAIASSHPLATEAGFEILAQGGNAFDAATAIASTLAVVEPYGSGLGGGGFWLLHRARDAKQVFLDARETAPGAATPARFLTPDGQRLSQRGPLAAGIPGLPAALEWMTRNYGRLPLSVTLAPAQRLAREGFPVDARYAANAGYFADSLDASAAAIFLDRGRAPEPGWTLRQPRLADTLQILAQQGSAGFYQGPVAVDLVRSVREHGGLWTFADLRDYRVVERKPLVFNHGCARIVTAPPPSAGGIALAQSLRLLDTRAPFRDPHASPGQDAAKIRDIAYVLGLAFRDRARHAGDPDHVEVPVARLLSRDHLDALARAGPGAAPPAVSTDGHTTHFSVVDAEGNRVAATLTINTFFGSGFVAGNTGVLLNNEMDDFDLGTGSANAYHLSGDGPNLLAPGRRPVSSMTPTFVEDARGVLILGTPGGSRIISQVLLAVLDHLRNPPDPARSVGLPRFHAQASPQRIEVEPDSFDPALLENLRELGHEVVDMGRRWGAMQAVWIDSQGCAQAASDPRGLAGAKPAAACPVPASTP